MNGEGLRTGWHHLLGGPLLAAPAWWPEALPDPRVTLLVVLSTLLVGVVVAVFIIKVVVPGAVRLAQTLRRAWVRVTPESSFGKVVVLFSVMMLVVMGPTSLALVDAKAGIEDIAPDSGYTVELRGDTITATYDGEGDSTSSMPRPSPDADGDRLLDSWERAGETPNGVPLPDADPQRKDLYLQVLYGSSVDSLNESERADLRRIWAEMPVDNPDGSRGITLHLVDERRLDAAVTTYKPSRDFIRDRYTPEYLDGAECVYYQTVFGEIEQHRLGGRAPIPGYVSVVDGTVTRHRGDHTVRVAVLTHELLHNTAGDVEGSHHTTDGWLSPTYDGSNAYLTEATATDLEAGFEVGPYEEQEVCS